MELENTYIPQHLDVPERFLVFTADEAIAFVIPLLIGIIVFNFLIGLIAAGIVVTAIRRFKQGASLARIYHALYWLCPPDIVRMKATPPSAVREMAG